MFIVNLHQIIAKQNRLADHGIVLIHEGPIPADFLMKRSNNADRPLRAGLYFIRIIISYA
jgi:hypothetical protein